MRNLTASVCLTFVMLLGSAGVVWGDELRATTEDGRNVILMGDGTWVFADDTTENTEKCDDIRQLEARALGMDDLENIEKYNDKYFEELKEQLKCSDDKEIRINVDDIELIDDL